jgi:hypothetical protein
MSLYRDKWIECAPDEIRIRGYYFPWGGTKRIPYRTIDSIRRVDLAITRGRARIWGTANPRYWASLDPGRPRKKAGLILDIGKPVRPFVTPDDPDAVESIIRERAGLGRTEHSERGPLI